jgi:hypothetical protein
MIFYYSISQYFIHIICYCSILFFYYSDNFSCSFQASISYFFQNKWTIILFILFLLFSLFFPVLIIPIIAIILSLFRLFYFLSILLFVLMLYYLQLFFPDILSLLFYFYARLLHWTGTFFLELGHHTYCSRKLTRGLACGASDRQ